MNPDGTPNVDDATKAVEAATGVIGAIQKLFPGVTRRSLDKAESKATERILKDVALIQESGEKLGLSDETLREFANDAFRRHGKRERFDKVVSFATDSIISPENISSIDPEWSDDFQNYAESSYDEDMQRLWGAILAGEINNPGGFSKRTMSILKGMSKSEAEAFKKVCEYSITINYDESGGIKAPLDPYIVLTRDESGGSYNSGEVFVSLLGVLDSLGLVDTSLTRTFTVFPSMTLPFRTGSDVVVVQNEGEDPIDIGFRHAVFLPVGVELAKVCGVGNGANLRSVLNDKLTSLGLKTIWLDNY